MTRKQIQLNVHLTDTKHLSQYSYHKLIDKIGPLI